MTSLKTPKDDRGDLSDDFIARIERVVAAGDALAFEALIQTVDWESRSPEDFLRAVQLALEVGAYAKARLLSTEAAESHPRNREIQKYARALAPPKISRKKVPPDPTIKANRDWLANNGDGYRGKWVGLRNGRLLGSANSLSDLVDRVGNDKDILMTRVY